jgi:hypothetical protein
MPLVLQPQTRLLESIVTIPLLLFKYAVSGRESGALRAVLLLLTLADPATLMPFGFDYLPPVGISFFTFQSLS